MSGGVEHDHVLDRRLDHRVPIGERLRSTVGLMRSLNEEHRHLELGGRLPEIHLLQLRVQRGEGVHERPDDVYLIDQGVLTDQQVLRHLTRALGVAGVVVGIHVLLVRQCGLIGEHRRVRRRSGSLKLVDQTLVARRFGPRERVLVEDAVAGQLAHHLAGPDEGPVQIRPLLHGHHAQRRPP